MRDLENIGRLIVASQEAEEERRRREEEDQLPAFKRSPADAEPAEQTGITFEPAIAPPIPFTEPRFGGSLPPGGTEMGVAAPGPGYLGGGSATPALSEIGRLSPGSSDLPETPQLGRPVPAWTGRLREDEPSAAEREETVLQAATRMASGLPETRRRELLAAENPGVVPMTPPQQTLVAAGDVSTTVVPRANARTAAAESPAKASGGTLTEAGRAAANPAFPAFTADSTAGAEWLGGLRTRADPLFVGRRLGHRVPGLPAAGTPATARPVITQDQAALLRSWYGGSHTDEWINARYEVR